MDRLFDEWMDGYENEKKLHVSRMSAWSIHILAWMQTFPPSFVNSSKVNTSNNLLIWSTTLKTRLETTIRHHIYLFLSPSSIPFFSKSFFPNLLFHSLLFRLPSKPTSFATRTRPSLPSSLMTSSRSLPPSVFKRSPVELVSKRCKFFSAGGFNRKTKWCLTYM